MVFNAITSAIANIIDMTKSFNASNHITDDGVASVDDIPVGSSDSSQSPAYGTLSTNGNVQSIQDYEALIIPILAFIPCVVTTIAYFGMKWYDSRNRTTSLPDVVPGVVPDVVLECTGAREVRNPLLNDNAVQR